jgi:hypothetical protein
MQSRVTSLKHLGLIALGLIALHLEPAAALPKKTIAQLRSAATAHFKAEGSMSSYTVMIVKGKAFASTRGVVHEVPHIAIWELNGGAWQFVFEHDQPPADPKATHEMYRHYGFTQQHEARLLKGFKPFAGAKTP